MSLPPYKLLPFFVSDPHRNISQQRPKSGEPIFLFHLTDALEGEAWFTYGPEGTTNVTPTHFLTEPQARPIVPSDADGLVQRLTDQLSHTSVQPRRPPLKLIVHHVLS